MTERVEQISVRLEEPTWQSPDDAGFRRLSEPIRGKADGGRIIEVQIGPRVTAA
jgi:hypothetical protein